MNPATPARRFAPLLFALIGMSLALGQQPLGIAETAVEQAQGAPAAAISLTQADNDRLNLTLNPPPLQRETVSAEGRTYDRLSMAGYGRLSRANAPDLPYTAYLLAVPPGAQPTLRLTAASSYRLDDIIPLPAPVQDLVAYDDTDPAALPTFATHYPIAAQARAADSTTPVSLGAVFWFRDVRLVPLIVQPAQFEADTQTLVVFDHLEVEVRFTYPDGVPLSVRTRPENPTFERILAPHILNYAQSQTWREWRTPHITGGASLCLDANAYRLSLQQTGLYKVMRADLTAMPDVALSALRMCYEGQEIAIKVWDKNNNNAFDGSDEIWFYGQSIKTRDTQTNVYWLTYGGSGHARMATLDGAPGNGTPVSEYTPIIHLERDELYQPRFPLDDPNSLYDHWFSNPIAYGYSEPTTWSAEFNLSNKSAAANAQIRAEVWGYTDESAHRFQMVLNGHILGIFGFDGNGQEAGPQLFTANANPDWLINGANTITIEALANQSEPAAHRMVVNWVEIAPRRQLAAGAGQVIWQQPSAGTWKYQLAGFSGVSIFDVSNPNSPREISNHTNSTFQPDPTQTTFPAAYVATDAASFLSVANGALSVQKDTASNLRASGNAADYIIITQPGLNSALTPLVNLRTSQGLTVKKTYVQDIFDEFGYGRYATQAIRDFVEYAYFAWTGGSESQPTPPPAFVLLAGDSSYDHRNVLGQNGNKDQVPAYLRSGVDSWMGEAAADNQYVALGDQRDLPYLLLGRLPAENAAELTTMISKILAYEAAPPAPGWQNHHLFISDNTLQDRVIPPGQYGCVPDPAGDFFSLMNEFLTDHFPTSQDFQRLYYAECYEDEPPQSYYAYDPISMGNRFVGDYNQGNAFVVYFGHAGPTLWAAEQFVTLDVVNALNNGGRTPIMLPMTCLEGQSHLSFNGLSETLLKRSNGAVASFAPTGLQVHTGHDYLLDGFYAGVFEDGLPELGAAVFSGKLLLKTSTPAYQDLHDTYTLLGDPAMRFNIWQAHTRLSLPVMLKH